MTSLSIIIINYKSAQLILDCLETLYAETKKISFEVIIVDNDSGDDSKSIISEHFPEIRWIDMGYNAGFARANNEGIRQSTGTSVLLLNADTLIENNAIENCYEEFSKSNYVACGIQLLNEDRTAQISGNYFVHGGLNYLLPLPYLGGLIKWMGTKFNAKVPHVPDSDSVIEVDWINGAFLMAKKTAIDKAGLLDEDFFLYAEEAEWCSRLGKVGKLCIFGNLKIVHLQGEIAVKTFNSTGKEYGNLFDRKGAQIMISNMVRIRKQSGAGWFLFNLFFYVLEIPIFFFGTLVSRIFSPGKKNYSFKQVRGYCRNIITLVGLCPTIIRNKPHFYKVL